MITTFVLMSIASGASFLLGFLLVNHPLKINATANRWLGVFITTLGLAMLEILLISQNLSASYPYYIELIGISRFITAPALYLTVCTFTSLDQSFKKKYLLHFIPLFIILLFRLPFFVTGQNPEFPEAARKVVFFIIQSVLPVQSVVYWILSYKKLQQHLRNINTFSSVTENIDLSWLKSFLFLLLVILLIWFNLLYFDIQLVKDFTPFFYLVCIFFLAYFSLQQREIFKYSPAEIEDLSEVVTGNTSPKAEKTKRLSNEQLAVLNQKLIHLMEVEKLYLDNELNLPDLSSKINASSNETSYLINEIYDVNFYTFINTFRIEEAKKLLKSEQYTKLNILGIAYQSGFNSKTTFNTAFRKITGKSPTEYIRQEETKETAEKNNEKK